jgi:DNA-binding transcriptional LysR family regulator
VRVAHLLEDPLLVAAARDHPLAGRTAVTPDELRSQRWVAGSSNPESSLLGAWIGSPWTPEIAFVARDWNAKLGLVAAGHGVTVVPGLAATVLPPTLTVIRIDDPAAVRKTAIAVNADTSSERHRTVTEALVDSAAELSAELRRDLRV